MISKVLRILFCVGFFLTVLVIVSGDTKSTDLVAAAITALLGFAAEVVNG